MVFLTYGDEVNAETMINRYRDIMDPRHHVYIANHFWRLGWLAAIRHQFALAKSQLLECHDLLKSMHIPFIELLATGGLVQVCTELEEFDAARFYLDKTHALAKLINYPQLKLFYCNYLEAYWHDKQGDIAQALTALRKAFDAANSYGWVVFSLWEKDMMTRLCLLALQHDIQPGYVKHLIAIYKYTPPEHKAPIEQWPYPLKIYTLGRFSLLIDDKAQDLSGKSAARPMDLLKCLIALGGRNVSQDKLIQALWPEAEVDAGIKSFHTTLYRLRKLIALDDAIALKDGLLSLDVRFAWVDVWTLERILTQLDQACRKADTVDEVEHLSQQALKYYKGPFLGQEKDQIWMLAYRDKLQSRMLRSLNRLGQFWQGHAHNDRVITAYEYMLEVDRLYEPAYQHLLQLYLQQGRLAEAVATYERCRKTFSSVLGVMPSTRTIEMYKRIPINTHPRQTHTSTR